MVLVLFYICYVLLLTLPWGGLLRSCEGYLLTGSSVLQSRFQVGTIRMEAINFKRSNNMIGVQLSGVLKGPHVQTVEGIKQLIVFYRLSLI